MWVRIIVVLIGLVLFLNGCNSLTSQLFGTHVLRTYTAETVAQSGIQDADYVEVTEAWQTGDYYIVPPRNANDRSVLVYPVINRAQLGRLQDSQLIQPIALIWTREFDPACDLDASCASFGEVRVKGIVRDMNSRKRASVTFPEGKYTLAQEPFHLERGKAPLSWYWNGGMMLLGIGAILYFETRAARKRRDIIITDGDDDEPDVYKNEPA